MPYKSKIDQKSWTERNPTYARDMQLRRTYGITLSDYNDLLSVQNGVCALCGKAPKPDAKRNQKILHVDHKHDTGKVRGLLCSNCNRGLGMLGDDPVLLARASQYVTDGR